MLLAADPPRHVRGRRYPTLWGKLYGQEKNLTTAAVARMNLFLHGIEDFSVERGDTLRQPGFPYGRPGDLRLRHRQSALLAGAVGRRSVEDRPLGPGLRRHAAPSSGDFAWVQHMVKSMADVTGAWPWCCRRVRSFAAAWRADPAEPAGARPGRGGDRAGAEPLLRHRSRGLHAGASPAQPEREEGARSSTRRACSARAARRTSWIRSTPREILGWVAGFADVQDRARVVTLDEIEGEDWTLNISRYVLPPLRRTSRRCPWRCGIQGRAGSAAWPKSICAGHARRWMARCDEAA